MMILLIHVKNVQIKIVNVVMINNNYYILVINICQLMKSLINGSITPHI
jgi:hypothetical protein